MIKIHKEGRLIVAITMVVLLALIAGSARLFPVGVNYVTFFCFGCYSDPCTQVFQGATQTQI